ncbi:tripartite tricarboxylate transporter substrate binding protein [Salipiger sp. PrR003]|uniref:Bug family tripartite tricarboxylate transporter substrate binding protein n=1 Tax=Salipiger sp. PrR003 TaxID=2706776 RepID=UPI0013DAF3B1|nr:tripartite tricarboxylate transporter substrate binding protein [Salipiger sp. PrR003]NDV52702.1 tripartite tricarboxylate transporter substrate binding protein [Salipiger sp. PrR003]
MKPFGNLTTVMAIASSVTLASMTGAMAQEFPSRGIEFVAGYGPGGGHDTMLRTMARIIQDEKLVDANINVVNKPGGAGATSLGYLNSHEGDGHYLMAATSSFITTPLATDVGLNYTDFTPIARMGIDPTILVVNARSPIENLDDIISSERVLNVAGGGRGQIEHLATLMVSDELGVELNFIPFQGDGEVATAVLSNQVDFAMINPGSVSEFIESGRVRAISISTEERAEAFPDLPTFREQGYNVVASVFRGVVAADGISDEAKAYLSDMVEKVQETEAWKTTYLEPNGVIPGYLGPDEFEAYLEETNDLYTGMLERLGLLGG